LEYIGKLDFYFFCSQKGIKSDEKFGEKLSAESFKNTVVAAVLSLLFLFIFCH